MPIGLSLARLLLHEAGSSKRAPSRRGRREGSSRASPSWRPLFHSPLDDGELGTSGLVQKANKHIWLQQALLLDDVGARHFFETPMFALFSTFWGVHGIHDFEYVRGPEAHERHSDIHLGAACQQDQGVGTFHTRGPHLATSWASGAHFRASFRGDSRSRNVDRPCMISWAQPTKTMATLRLGFGTCRFLVTTPPGRNKQTSLDQSPPPPRVAMDRPDFDPRSPRVKACSSHRCPFESGRGATCPCRKDRASRC